MGQTVTGVVGTVIGASCTTPDFGALVKSDDLKNLAQSVCNDLATIKSGNCTVGGTKTFSGACTFSNTVQVQNTLTANGPLVTNDRRIRRGRVVLADADQTVDPTHGDVLELTPAPASNPRVIKLRAPPPAVVGESLELVVGGALTGNANYYTIKREDGLLVIAEFWGAAADDVAPCARFDCAIPVVNVASTSNTTPIEVTTQEGHVFVTGDAVTIAGCSDSHANGSHPVTRTGLNTFTLTGTTANGGGGGGTATGDQATWRLGMNSGGGSTGGVVAGPGA